MATQDQLYVKFGITAEAAQLFEFDRVCQSNVLGSRIP